MGANQLGALPGGGNRRFVNNPAGELSTLVDKRKFALQIMEENALQPEVHVLSGTVLFRLRELTDWHELAGNTGL